jgi:hypothetical protein
MRTAGAWWDKPLRQPTCGDGGDAEVAYAHHNAQAECRAL